MKIILSKDSLLQDLFKYTERMESPENYRFWCSAYTIASHLGSRVWTKFADSKLFPNFYIILVGSSWTRKTTCINTYGDEFLKKCPHPFVEGSITPSKLRTLLSQNDTVNILNSELPVITSGKDQIAEILTDHRKNVNMLSATRDTKWIDHDRRIGNVEKNFAHCVLFVAHLGETSIQPKPELLDYQEALKPKIAERLGEISKLHGEYPISEEALEYNRGLPLNNPMSSHNRKRIQIKLALVICISEGDREIKIHHVKQAHKLLDLLEEQKLAGIR